MLNNQILEYFRMQKSVFTDNFRFAAQNANEEAIHDMRVSIKRLRLLYKFVDYASNGKLKSKKRIKPLNKVFRSAAKLRDIQIQLHLLQNVQNELNLNLLKDNEKLQNIASLETEKLILYFSAFNYQKIEKQFLKAEEKIKRILENKDIGHFYDAYKANRLNKIKKLMNNPQPDYHKIRKRIKEIAYLTEIKEQNSQELIALKQIGKELGNWHDIEVFLNIPYLKHLEIEKYYQTEQLRIIEEFNKLYAKLFIQA